MESFKYVAPVAGALGFTIEDTSKAIGLMANAGIKGSQAGTSLRTMMTNLAKPTAAMKKQMDKLGISLTDSEGNMKSFDEIMMDIRGSFKDLTEEQQASAAATIFGKEAMSGALAIVGASQEDYDKLGDAINNSSGAAKKMAEIMEGELGGTLREIKSGLEGFAISIYEEMEPALKKAASGVKGFVGWLNDLSPRAKKTAVVIGGIAAAIGPLLVGLGTAAVAVGSVMTAVAPLTAAIAGAGGLAAAIGTAGGVLLTLATGPVAIAIAAIAGIGIGTAALVKHLKKDAIPEVNHFGDTVSEKTKKALGGFMDLNDGAVAQLTDMNIRSTVVTDKIAKDLKETYGGMNKEVLDGMKKNHEEQISEMETFFKNSSALSVGREQEIIQKQKEANASKEKEQQRYEERAFAIIDKASKEKRELTQNEQDQLDAIRQVMADKAVEVLTDNEREQKVILERMKTESGKITAKQAAETVQNSKKATDKVIKDAEKTYNDTVAFAIEQRDEHGSISAEEAQAIIDDAKAKYKESTKNAEDTHKEVVKSAKEQAKDHVKEVDWETGEVKSKWEVMKTDVVDKAKKIKEDTSKWFKDKWKNLSKGTKDGVKGVKDDWEDLKERTKEKAKDMGISVVKYGVTQWNDLKKNTVDGVRDVKAKWEDMKTQVKNKAENMRKGATDKVQELRTGIENKTSAMKTKATGLWTGFKDSVLTTVRSMRTKVDEIFGKIVDGATALPGNMKDGIVKMAGKAVDGIKNVGQKMANKFGAVVNGLTGGLNTITTNLGLPKSMHIPKWTVPQFAYGTDSHKGGPMIVGDKYGRELVELPTGETFLSPDTDTLLNAPKGTRVIPNKITEQYLKGDIPEFAKGAGVGSWLKDKAAGFKNAMSNVWDYMKSPSKLLDLIPLPKIEGLSGGMATMAKGAVSFVKDKALDFIKNAFTKSESSGGPVGSVGPRGPFPSPFRLTSRAGMRYHPIFKRWQMHWGDDWAAPQGTRIPSRGDGRVVHTGYHSALGNYVDVQTGPYKFRYQHNLRNMVSKGDMVKNGQTIGLVGRTGNSTGPHLHFETHKGKQKLQPKSLGFATGGLINAPGMYNLAEEGHSEFVIPTAPKRRTDAMKLLALAGKAIAGKGNNKRPNQLGGSSGGGVFEQMLSALIEQTQQNSEQIALLAQLLQKDSNLYVDGHELGRTVAPGTSQGIHNMTNIKNAVKGLT